MLRVAVLLGASFTPPKSRAEAELVIVNVLTLYAGTFHAVCVHRVREKQLFVLDISPFFFYFTHSTALSIKVLKREIERQGDVSVPTSERL